MFKVPEQYRITKGELASDFLYGNNGAFKVFRGRTTFLIIASDGMGWEHVSVHCLTDGKERTPTWSEMCFVKDLFWSDDDCVIQYHPVKDQYVNTHKHTLHLWKPVNQVIPIPFKEMV